MRFRGLTGSLAAVSIGGRIKQLRGSRSQEAVAYDAGISVSTLQRIEAGEHEPRLSTIRALAAVLGVSIAELIDTTE